MMCRIEHPQNPHHGFMRVYRNVWEWLAKPALWERKLGLLKEEHRMLIERRLCNQGALTDNSD